MKYLSIIAALLTAAQVSVAAESYVVKLKPGINPVQFEIQNNVSAKLLAPGSDLYKVTPLSENQGSTLSLIKNQTNKVVFAQPNHKIEYREKKQLQPNDTEFSQLWNMMYDENNAGIDAISAWGTFGTDGTDANGHEVVIAVVDGGFQFDHNDLVGNLWTNKAEIAGNEIDDDGNGYIDDINGWDTENNTGVIQSDYHGTHVAGIMGAKGDNSLFTVGVNWNIKIMYVSMGYTLADTAATMAAYSYIQKQKELWIQSGGTKGANVVAINSSFGIDQADCNSTEYAAWNTKFDELGAVGILSVAATANADWDIDTVGDVPTGCKSDYVVAVTNSDIKGDKADAGYGQTTIDLAAPGTDIHSTYPGHASGPMSGTSMATPHVTGAVGYLYSVASAAFANRALSDPKGAALDAKNILVTSVVAKESMKTQSVSGGILNLYNAADKAANYVSATVIQ